MDCFLRVVGDNLRAGSSQESISETIQEFDNHRSIVTCLCWYVEGEKGNGFVDSWEGMILGERRRNHGPKRMRSTDETVGYKSKVYFESYCFPKNKLSL